MATMGPQNPTLVQPGSDPVGRGIQNKVANYSDTAVAEEVAALTDRTTMWQSMGVWVGASAPATPATYAAWVDGATGYWGWIEI